MTDQLNRVRFATDTTGTGSSIHVNGAFSTSYFTPTEAGAVDGRPYTYVVQKSNDFEIQENQIWTNSSATIARGTPTYGKIGGVAGTTKITLDNTCTITFGPSAANLLFEQSRGADVASAATLDLTGTTGKTINLTGTTGITAVTMVDGQERMALYTGAGLTITVGASLVGNAGGANITLATNDLVIFKGYASNVVRFSVIRLSGKPLIGPSAADITDGGAVGRTVLQGATDVIIRPLIYAAPFDALAYTGMQMNGSMDVSQENGTGSIAIATGGVNKYLLDGCYVQKDGTSVLAAQQVASVFPGYAKELKLTVSTAQASIGANFFILSFPIEGWRIARAAWGTASAVPITVGFWVKSTVAASFLARMSGGSNVDQTLTINSGATAQFMTATFPAQTSGTWPTDNTAGAVLNLYLALTGQLNIVSSTSNTFEMTGLIVLPGVELPSSTRAPFIMRPIDQELLVCKRQLHVSNPSASTGGAAGMINAVAFSTTLLSVAGRFPVPMRTTSTVTFWNNTVQNQVRNAATGGTVAVSSPTAFSTNEQGFGGLAAGSGTPFTAGSAYDFDYIAKAQL